MKPVEIVLFSDFQCPFCAQLSKPFRELQTKGVDGVKTAITFKHFPLSIHSQAPLAHQAAVAAGRQGKFWEMHDALFANQAKATRADLLSYAEKLGLDLKRFEADMDSDATKALIKTDVAEGEKRQVSGTPTMYVNGKEFVGARTFDQLQLVIRREYWGAKALTEISDSMLAQGKPSAPVQIELFVDLQSPVSAPALAAVRQIVARYPADVRLQFRNFPLAFHPQAALAHEAAMAAAKDGKFWEFASFALEHQSNLREQDLIALASRLGMNATAFAESLRQHRYAARVDLDVDAGRTRGIKGSPAIVIGDKRIDGVPTIEALAQSVEAALAKKTLIK